MKLGGDDFDALIVDWLIEQYSVMHDKEIAKTFLSNPMVCIYLISSFSFLHSSHFSFFFIILTSLLLSVFSLFFCFYHDFRSALLLVLSFFHRLAKLFCLIPSSTFTLISSLDFNFVCQIPFIPHHLFPSFICFFYFVYFFHLLFSHYYYFHFSTNATKFFIFLNYLKLS